MRARECKSHRNLVRSFTIVIKWSQLVRRHAREPERARVCASETRKGSLFTRLADAYARARARAKAMLRRFTAAAAAATS